MLMSSMYRSARSKLKNPMDKCGWCKYKFVDGEMMALAATVKSRNMVLCQKCAAMITPIPERAIDK